MFSVYNWIRSETRLVTLGDSRVPSTEVAIKVRGTARGGGLGSSTIFKNLMSPTPCRKWYLTTGRRAH